MKLCDSPVDIQRPFAPQKICEFLAIKVLHARQLLHELDDEELLVAASGSNRMRTYMAAVELEIWNRYCAVWLKAHGGFTWEEIYNDWKNEDLKYYWEKNNMTFSDWDTSIHIAESLN